MNFRTALGLTLFCVPTLVSAQELPEHYPADYEQVVEAARQEGRVVVYGTFDPPAYGPMVAGFEAKFPGVTVEFNSMSSTPMYSRFISEVAAGGATADVLFSSAMDLQVRLVSDGYAMEYRSPEIDALPDWASWNDRAYAATIDPVTFIYNKALLSEDQVPRTHAEVADKFREHQDVYRGRIVTYDSETSGVGFLYLTRDHAEMGEDVWDIYRAMNEASAVLGSGTSNIIESVGAGEHVLAYNMLGAYARPIADINPDLGIVMPTDFTHGTLRVMFINDGAAHPNAARLFLDYVLSAEGQEILMNESEMYSIRTDFEEETSVGGLISALGDALRPIPINEELLETLEPDVRVELIDQWKRAFQGQ